MHATKFAVLGGMLLSASFALADASYQTSSQITGGQFVDALKSQAFIAKQVNKMFAPTNRILMVHGNQKAEVSKDFTEIIDLDKGEMIRIDHVKKTYTIVTFAQMRDMMATLANKMAAQPKQPSTAAPPPPNNFKIDFTAEAKNTGVTKVVNGLTAQEQVVTVNMIMSVTNAPPGQQGSMTYTVVTDAWIAPDPPALKEINDFDLRMAQKMMEGVDMSAFVAQMRAASDNGNAAMAQMFGGHPGSGEAMAQMQKEMAKIKGVRILEVTSMGGDAPAGPPGTAGTPASTTQTQGSVGGQIATDTATQTASSESSKLGTFGSALTNSALNAFRKKKSTPPPAQPATPPPAAPSGTAPAMQHVVLMEMTDQKTNFSQEPIPASVFQIPAGYKLVPTVMPH